MVVVRDGAIYPEGCSNSRNLLGTRNFSSKPSKLEDPRVCIYCIFDLILSLWSKCLDTYWTQYFEPVLPKCFGPTHGEWGGDVSDRSENPGLKWPFFGYVQTLQEESCLTEVTIVPRPAKNPKFLHECPYPSMMFQPATSACERAKVNHLSILHPIGGSNCFWFLLQKSGTMPHNSSILRPCCPKTTTNL